MQSENLSKKSNEEMLERTKVHNLHDTVDKRQRRFVGHVQLFHQQDQSVKMYSGL